MKVSVTSVGLSWKGERKAEGHPRATRDLKLKRYRTSTVRTELNFGYNK